MDEGFALAAILMPELNVTIVLSEYAHALMPTVTE
jgi:hypothetical protein